MCVASTGSGKTEMFIELVRRAQVRAVVLVGRDKLVEQTARRLRRVVPDAAVWSAGQGERNVGEVTVVSVHSADNLTIEGLRLIVVDEAHNLNDGRYASFLSRHPAAKVVGFTATPWRGGVEIFGEGCFFPEVNYSIGLDQLIRDGHLLRPVAVAMPEAFSTSKLQVRGGEFVLSELTKLVSDKGKIELQVRDAIPRLVGRNKIVWTCVSIEHAENVADVLAMLDESAIVIHSKVKDAKYAISCFEHESRFRHAVSVMMLSEGIDIPSVDAIVLMRPTRSPTLMVQTIGRGLRPHPGQTTCAILDYGEVIRNCGPVNAPYVKSPGERRTRDKFTPTIRVCSACLAYVPVDVPVCPECGHEEKRVVDRLKALKMKADEEAVLLASGPSILKCVAVRAMQHKSMKGNNCIKLRFDFADRLTPAYAYGSPHDYSWRKFQEILYKLTPFRFESWQECYDVCEELVFDVPESVAVKTKEGFENVIRVYTRADDT